MRILVFVALSLVGTRIAHADCALTNPVVAAASLSVSVTRVGTDYRYEYVIRNPSQNTGCIYGASIDVSTRAAAGPVTATGSIARMADVAPFLPVEGTYDRADVPYCGGGVGGIGRIGWNCVDVPVAGTDPVEVQPGPKATPGSSLLAFTIVSPKPPSTRAYSLFVDFKDIPNPDLKGVTLGPTEPSEMQTYDGGGQKPIDVNLFLTYTNPLEHRTTVSQAEFPLSVRYGVTVVPASFKATLNGTDVSGQFHPVAGEFDVVALQLAAGSNTLVLSIDGRTASGRVATDTDRLVLLAP